MAKDKSDGNEGESKKIEKIARASMKVEKSTM